MNDVFADTSGWANFFVRTEPFHSEAKSKMQECHASGRQLVTTNYILVELIALMTNPLRIPRGQQIRLIESIKVASWVEIVHVDRTLDDEAWTLLKQRNDKTWSLVDCASFVVMRHRNITEAFTADHHFEQAGLVRLLK